MRQGLIDLKKEIEAELLSAKQVWIDSFTRKYITSSPLPGRSDFSTGFFVNQTQIRVGSRLYSFGLNKKSRQQRSDTFKFKRVSSERAPITIRVEFKINRPYDKISITNHVHYNKFIEYIGWKKTEAYRPFTKATKTAGNSIRRYLGDKSKNTDKHSKLEDLYGNTGIARVNQSED